MKYRLHVQIQSLHFPSEIAKAIKDAGYLPDVKQDGQMIGHFHTNFEATWTDADMEANPQFEVFHNKVYGLMDEWQKTLSPTQMVLSAMLGETDNDDPAFHIHGFPHWIILKEITVQ